MGTRVFPKEGNSQEQKIQWKRMKNSDYIQRARMSKIVFKEKQFHTAEFGINIMNVGERKIERFRCFHKLL